MSSGTGRCCGASPCSTACSPSCPPGFSCPKEHPMDARPRKRLLAALAVVAVVAIAGVVVFLPRHAAAPPLSGMVRQTEIRIAPEITGPLVSLPVRGAHQVHKGD